MAGAVLEGVVVDKPIEVVCQRTGHFGWATGAGAIHQALDPLVGEAMDPLAQRGIGKVQRVGHRLEAVPLDDLAYGLGTAEDAGLLGLLKEGIQGGESLLGKVEFEGPHSGGLQEKLLQKFTQVHSSWVLLSEQNLFDSNFSGAADGRREHCGEAWYLACEIGTLGALGHLFDELDTLIDGLPLPVSRYLPPQREDRLSIRILLSSHVMARW